MLTGLENDYWPVILPLWETIEFKVKSEDYKKSISQFTKIQLDIFASHLMVCEVKSGGFNQFYFNDTGITIYEALEGFKSLGMLETATLVQKTIDSFGEVNLHDKMTRVSGFDFELNELSENFIELSSTEKEGFDIAANKYLHEHLHTLDKGFEVEIDKRKGKKKESKENILNWEELYETYSEKEGDEDFYSQTITDVNLANLFEKFIDKKIIESAVDTYQEDCIGNLLANSFIKALKSDYCIDYTFKKFLETEDPYTKQSLAHLLGNITNPRILKYYDELLEHKKFKGYFGYILHDLIDQKLVEPEALKDELEKLKGYNENAYSSLIDKINN